MATLNVDGLRTNEKRNKIFQYLQNSQYDVILLQETHVQIEDINKWKQEWSYFSIWHPGDSNQTCGVGILINGRKNVTVIDYKKDLSGRILNIKIQYKRQKIQIISLYAPATPYLRENFYKNLKNYIFEDTPIIMGGGGLQHGGMPNQR